jgi:hypothetical protein
MPPIEQRVAQLEGRMDDHKEHIVNLREEMREFRAETRAEFAAVRTEFAALRETDDRHFLWLVGIMVTGFLTGFGTMITLFLRVLDRLP